jgi:hypothetical protein
MAGNRRGISAKDLRPFSVEDPLGQGRQGAGVRAGRTAALGSPSAQRVSSAPERARPPAAAQVARLGCLAVIAIWAMGLIASAAAWLPQLVREVRPVLERALAKWEVETRGTAEPRATDAPSPPLPSADAVPSREAAPPAVRPTDPLEPAPEPAADPAKVELERVCARTVLCCLTVQGERARSLCENFRGIPVVESCQQAYDAFAQVGRQLGRPCQE